MDNSEKKEVDFSGFLEKLKQGHEFPGSYTFKFIYPTNHQTLALLQQLFDAANPQFQMKSSKNGKYTSLTVVVFAMDAEEIVNYYKQAGKIKNVILL